MSKGKQQIQFDYINTYEESSSQLNTEMGAMWTKIIDNNYQSNIKKKAAEIVSMNKRRKGHDKSLIVDSK